jgi:hypothetical protein
MAAVALTQEEKDALKQNADFRKYLVDSIMGDDFGGIGYILRLGSFADPAQAISYIVARQIRSNPSIVHEDQQLLNYLTIQINVRDIDKKDDEAVGDLLAQVIAYLNAANRINLIVQDYFAEKGKNW